MQTQFKAALDVMNNIYDNLSVFLDHLEFNLFSLWFVDR